MNLLCKDENNPVIVMNTHFGTIHIKLFIEKAPVTCNNFLRYIDENRYGDFHFYRSVTMENQPNDKIRIEVIQGGLGFEQHPLELPPILHETTNITGINHLDGTVSMARLEPGTASSEIFICINDQPELDYRGKRNSDRQGFAAFGKVILGMDIIKRIHSLPEKEQLLNKNVKVNSIKRK
tara:strand:- start:482 stop:1021 length:540 start_codon:yes stop_codon:yes gene_type:complete